MISRREALGRVGCGFGYLALAGMVGAGELRNPLAARAPHFAPRAKRIIFIFMQGGPSHVDTFDYKPLLAKKDGEMVAFDDARVIANTGKRGSLQRVMKPLWNFSQHGETGHWVSELFPEMVRHVDDLCFIHSMQTEGVAHGPATLFLHCGSTNFTRPSMGSWVSYGLGTENENLPAFVTIAPSMGNGGARNYGNAFLPPAFQGTPLGRAGMPASEIGFQNLRDTSRSLAEQRRQFELIQKVSYEQLKNHPGDAELEAMIQSYELAWRLQSNAPETMDVSRELAETLAMYGVGEKATDNFGRQCLLARRMSEAGVRFVQVTYGDNTANPAWDQHSNLAKHAEHARAVDKPIAGLLEDLKRRGLLEDTILWWGSEFGRTPYAEKNGTGRDHNPGGFTVWLTGGGIKRGFSLGETDEFGHLAVRDRVHMHDLHATLLHLMGLDHEKLTFRHDGRDFRLTDVFGNVVREVIA
jgi:hypothetical protein